MKKQIGLVIALALVALLLVGCSSATPTPLPLPTQPPQVVTVVITATPPPATATPAQPTMTPVPTVALTTTVPAPSAATKAASSSSASTKPVVVASRTPTKVVVPPTATTLPLKYVAPFLLYPLWQPSFNTSQQDEVKYPGAAMVLQWKSVGTLYGDECYRVDMTSEPINAPPPPRSDYFVKCSNNDVATDATVTFTLNKPNQPGPNYSSLIIENASDMWVSWTVTVVKNLGQCVDSFHCKTAPLSQPSSKGRFLLKGS